jgi:hypothetical protein
MLEHEMTAAIFGAPILKPCWSGGICGEEPPVRSAYAIILGGVMGGWRARAGVHSNSPKSGMTLIPTRGKLAFKISEAI